MIAKSKEIFWPIVAIFMSFSISQHPQTKPPELKDKLPQSDWRSAEQSNL